MIFPTTIDLVRHGSTAFNEIDRMQGHEDVPLSQKGRNEVAALAKRLRDLPYDLIIHSPLKRAQETAQIIAADRLSARWQVYPELIEIDLGRWEGLVFSEMVKDEADFYQRWQVDPHLCVPGGESFAQVTARAALGLERLLKESAQTILICGHATINRGFLAALLSMPLQMARRFRMQNSGWSRFVVYEHENGLRPMVESWNVTDHLIEGAHAADSR